MPTRTTSAPDGNGGTITTTVTTSSNGRTDSIETTHTDRNGKEISNEVEARSYDANGTLREVLKQRRQGGRRRIEKTTYDPRGQPDSVTVRETENGKTVSFGHYGYRNGRPSTGYREEYDPPGTLRRRIREVYDGNGNIIRCTAIDYDASGRETGRKDETFGANGGRILLESLAQGGEGLVETLYEGDGATRLVVYRTPERGGKSWSTATVPLSGDGVVGLDATEKKPRTNGGDRRGSERAASLPAQRSPRRASA